MAVGGAILFATCGQRISFYHLCGRFSMFRRRRYADAIINHGFGIERTPLIGKIERKLADFTISLDKSAKAKYLPILCGAFLFGSRVSARGNLMLRTSSTTVPGKLRRCQWLVRCTVAVMAYAITNFLESAGSIKGFVSWDSRVDSAFNSRW